ncbi:GtrA family protein [Pseudoflavitalea rhizosphaerae]|uniref:GtrA family protein n=1 Tax=Pseudoflavitalea rhizosphaerae TaxID=1884793 RepID=UPI0013DFF737|nr:GtrA family protein [Pseudoflavitalea rhizosphaerae]
MMLKDWVNSIINLFYPPFKKWMPLQTFRYAACGGGNTLLDIFIYYISYNFILDKQVVHTFMGAISPHIMAFLISFAVSFPTGYLLNRFIVFPGSTLKGRVQLFRYFLLVVVCIGLNYIFIKLFVEQFHFYPTVAKIFTTVIVVSFSYLTQKQFTFKVETVKGNENA